MSFPVVCLLIPEILATTLRFQQSHRDNKQQIINSFDILLFITSDQSGITGGTGSLDSLGFWILDA